MNQNIDALKLEIEILHYVEYPFVFSMDYIFSD